MGTGAGGGRCLSRGWVFVLFKVVVVDAKRGWGEGVCFFFLFKKNEVNEKIVRMRMRMGMGVDWVLIWFE